MPCCFLLFAFLQALNLCNGHPIDLREVIAPPNGYASIIIGAAFLVSVVAFLVACACCRERRDGFKEFTNVSGSLTNLGFTNALASELSIFPPPGAGPRETSPPTPSSPHPPTTKPAAFASAIPNVSDWFDPNDNFSRQHLFYQRELGKGWFGKVVEGEAKGTKVVVRILREDATPQEKAFFLHEAKPFRDLSHKNVARLFGRCLEHEPYLLLFELCSNGDLKNFLVTNVASQSALQAQGITLKMMADVTEGLKFINENGFIHTDLAARNCLVSSDLTVKIGDYGTSIDLYKDEYYITSDVALPIRWCAPESLHCTPTTIETKSVTAAGNVWSLGVVLWEIAEFGKLPYHNLTDDQVIIRVFGSEKLRLPQPDCPYGHYLYNVMQMCWKTSDRANLEQVLSMLEYLKSNPIQEIDFETRWRSLKPNTVPRVDNHTPIHSPRHTELAQRPQLPAKMEFDSGVDLEIKTSDDNPDSATPMTISPQLSVTSEEIFQAGIKKSPSLTNLQGSLEDVSPQYDSWLQGVEQKTEEDRTFVKNISEAIKNLDETLALEKTSSSSADSSMECPKQPLLNFKLGPLEGGRRSESSSDTEEETWRHRIERGEFTEKVKEKSKSVTDLMVLTHIDSESSENDSLPSLTRQYSMRKNKSATFTNIGFGSEGNIKNAVLGEELQEKLKQLTLWKTEDQSFLVKVASDKNKIVRREVLCNKDNVVNVNSQLSLVNKACTEERAPLPRGAVALSQGKERSEVDPSKKEDVSSQTVEPNVPEIVITESELPTEEPEIEENLLLEDLVPLKPRKFVFICKDEDEDSSTYGSNSTVHESTFSNLDTSDTLFSQPLVENSNQETSSVILGSCEEHTLDFFKGLKTTFVPLESFSDDETVDKSEESEIISPVINLKQSDTKEFTTFENINGLESEELNSLDRSVIESEVVAPLDLNIVVPPPAPCEYAKEEHFPPTLSRVFNLSEGISHGAFSKESLSYDSFSSGDSGHSSERCAEQDQKMNDLKTRLEDVAKYPEEFQLKSSEEEYGGKLLTPDDERSSDSGFRDKGSLSESVEDTCDEKYNLEDIDAELDDYVIKNSEKEDFKYYEQFVTEPEKPMEGWFLHPPHPLEVKENDGWLSVSTEHEEKRTLFINDEFVAAIRSELQDKLPCAQLGSKSEEDTSPEDEVSTEPVMQCSYPSQLSPILEEQESNQSSLVLDDTSPKFILEPPDEIPSSDLNDEIVKAATSEETPVKDLVVEDLERGEEVAFNPDKFTIDDDLLIVDTVTNEATIVESPKPQSHLAFVIPRKLNENFKEGDSVALSSEPYVLSPDNPLTPNISSASTSSSPGNNLSGMCLSPCSIKSDLFDSGPPSLPFDLGQSQEEVEEISLGKPNNEAVEILQDLVDAGIVKKEDIIPDPIVLLSVTSETPEKVVQPFVEPEDTQGKVYVDKEQASFPVDKCVLETFLEAEKIISSDQLPFMLIPLEKNEVLHTPEMAVSSVSDQNLSDIKINCLDTVEPVLKPQVDDMLEGLLIKGMSDLDVNPVKESIEEENSNPKSTWLQQLLLDSSPVDSEKAIGSDALSLHKSDWPTMDELISSDIKEDKITSTLALMSPDVSTPDSKPHSLLSSFASTPTSDDRPSFSMEGSSLESNLKRVPNSLCLEATPLINAPMPSPEDADKGWRPTIGQLMELTDQADGEEMTTSFIEPDENGIYTPDWESDTSEDPSSSSGEFIWKGHEINHMERIDEEDEEADTSSDSSDLSSEGSGTEFVPSTWNSNATPNRSAIKTPKSEPKSGEKRKVVFKKEKYQCIYEYPREPSEDEDDSEPWQTPSRSCFDYSTFADWEMGLLEFPCGGEASCSDTEDVKQPKKSDSCDIYRLDFPFVQGDDGEFYISSSTRPLEWNHSSQFFPGEGAVTDGEEGGDFSPLASDLTSLKDASSGLGELRHTKDQLRLELPPLRPSDKGEASILDSGIDTASA